jgi:hypothetical protein
MHARAGRDAQDGGLLDDRRNRRRHAHAHRRYSPRRRARRQTFGGQGLEAFLSAKWRISWDTRSIVRVSVGGGFDDIDGGRGPERAGLGTSGVTYSLGAARELITPSGARIILPADIVVPHVNADIEGRRAPILELGFGYRIQDYNPFSALVPR